MLEKYVPFFGAQSLIILDHLSIARCSSPLCNESNAWFDPILRYDWIENRALDTLNVLSCLCKLRIGIHTLDIRRISRSLSKLVFTLWKNGCLIDGCLLRGPSFWLLDIEEFYQFQVLIVFVESVWQTLGIVEASLFRLISPGKQLVLHHLILVR
jgi:hypothetical protein